MKNYLQRMGRSLQLPVAVLPAAALLVGIGNWWAAASNDIVAHFLQAGGNAVLGQLPLLFAVGLALGMSKDKDGAAALAGLVAFELPTNVLKPESVATLLNIKVATVNPAFNQIGNVLIGVLSGLIAAALYNRFHETKLPMALSFFSGKRLVPILAAVTMLLASVVLLIVWPPVYDVLVAFGKLIVGFGAVGAGLYGFFNRLLIPTGLHQALNSVFWFDVAGINDIGKFIAHKGVKGITGMYQGGFFPVMMFGLPAGAYAIYRNARPERKVETASLMMAGAFASFFTGVTEPLEFSFMFVAWPLYVLHAVFTGLSLGFAAFMHWTAGFAFSAGFVDYVLSLSNPIANHPLMLIPQGLVLAVIYYFGFNFAIKKFHLMTPGREPITADDADDLALASVAMDADDDKYTRQAKQIYAALGGADNLTVIDNCTTRLRLQLKDTGTINEAAIKHSGAAGINKLDEHNLQIIIGTEVQFVADALTKLKAANAPISATSTSSEEGPTTTEIPGITSGVTTDFYSVVNGQYVDIEAVADKTFADKMLGDGFAINPSDGTICAPIDGTVSTVFPTKHAIGFKTASGLEILLHMGIDTVELNGGPFEILVQADQSVQHGEVVAKVDLNAINTAGKDATMMVIITNMAAVNLMKFKMLSSQVNVSDEIMLVTTK
ncbi:N-acetylglucosamine-specific PTS transporter subunit IIBC [Lactiplantibacillus pentosus]|uniref:N-acetylglucosamine-specific PTS transporter subunit IIBC n=1 Tax=Lactiplantibacillus pentosus TaxID=1589 RepID=UPI00132FFE15|nr:N-acetylglucosamine-specific PTS transporter subunit IIBC [Lactiplantibacillus pentosus]MBU7463919.1 N-acetylglucosamine-specific PTS transporter subunit IIBC [Lactiplantibacillus pentosus]MBU7489834.1 N-acetylglucosamine-specific PTS transporter subunit IIBC [Lactiplantibacillus pentosus]MBU7493284.1 N-acetylglucosamine-specific PTS transporter subunit IIBC [Lactiplantibacillus pentosus]MBU7519284.1 N-acetylglucosamine-specific PTS transporter subunit IIBC [Lactiplantibacillus pentosus]MBU